MFKFGLSLQEINLHKKRLKITTWFYLVCIGLVPLQLFFLSWFYEHPNFVNWYVSFYDFITYAQLLSLGWISISVGDLGYAFLAFWGVISIYRFLKIKSNRWHRLVKFFGFVALFYLLFNLFWGFNYTKASLDQDLGLKTVYTTKELIDFTCDLVQETNQVHLALASHDSIAVKFNFEPFELRQMVYKAYQNPLIRVPELDYPVASIKPSLWSIPLSYAGFSGYLNPFTKEAQYNSNMPQFKWPTTMAHEISHQLGYAKENEANFIGALVCIKSSNPHLRYAGLTFALKSSLNDIYNRDQLKFDAIVDDVNLGVIKQYKASREFWAYYSGYSEKMMKLVYDNFLKANNQPKGIETYSYVTGLLVNYHTVYNLF